MSFPTYSLEAVKNGIKDGNFRITFRASQDAMAIGLNEEDILNVGLGLLDSDFKKTMPANLRPGTMQDVYNPIYNGITLYYKVQLVGEVIIISCKEK